MRINKYLNAAGVASRREADRLIEAGKVRIGGRLARLGDDVPEGAAVEVEGKKVVPRGERTVIAFHKPVGVITTTDAASPGNILEALRAAKRPPPDTRLIPVGRLDVATSGLILLTDDTALADRLMRPASGVEKEYEVEIDREVLPEFLEKLAAGVDIGGYVTKNAQLSKIGSKSFAIVVTEGKNRQIRRMCEALGATVKRLRRVRIGGVRLGKLPKGGWRTLTDEELASLRP